MRVDRRTAAKLAALSTLSGLAACSTDTEDAPSSGPDDASPGSDAGPSESGSAATPRAESTSLPPVTSPESLPALMRERLPGSRLRLVVETGSTEAYRRWEVTYRAGDVTVSGVLLRPRGDGPFPGIVLNHGYIEPSIYQPGQGMSREQDYLARAGFAVLHTDYRGHAGSDPVTPLSRESRLGYMRDAIAAVRSLEREPYVDADRMAMMGRSMGGGVTLGALVAQPGLVRAAIAYSSVSSDFLENVEQFTQVTRPEMWAAFQRRYGTPQAEPAFYRALSPRTYFDRVSDPVLLIHGSLDESCPVRWARDTQRLLIDAGADSTLEIYRGESHAFGPQFTASMRRIERFLRNRL